MFGIRSFREGHFCQNRTDAHGSCSDVLAAASTTEVIRKQSVKYVDVCDDGQFFTHGHEFVCIFQTPNNFKSIITVANDDVTKACHANDILNVRNEAHETFPFVVLMKSSERN